MIAAIVPACGESQRMGRPKLVLPIGGEPLIARVVRRLREGGVDEVVVVTGPPELEGSDSIAEVALGAGGKVVRAGARTRDMRETFEVGLDWLEGREPEPEVVVLVPGDQPGLAAGTVRRLLAVQMERGAVMVVPSYEGRRGHPLVMAWRAARGVRELPSGVGVNALVERQGVDVVVCAVEDAGVVEDLDTPEEYGRWASVGE
jgi:molybdenum cofactor cytidylyltransferase